MKKTLTIMILCMAVAVAALAQQKPADQAPKQPVAMPTVDQILDRFVKELGGKAAMEKITSSASKGTFEITEFGATGPIEIWAKAPNKTAIRLDIPGFGIVQEGFNGTVAWAQEPQSGLREKAGPELAVTKLVSDFYRPIRLKQLYPKIVVKGTEKVGERDAYVLEATPADGPPETWYFDVASGLLVRSDAERESPQGKAMIQNYLEDYRDAGGVKEPFVNRIVSPTYTLIIKLDEVKYNVPIDDAKFNKPAAQ